MRVSNSAKQTLNSLVLLLVLPAVATAEIEITLKNTFINKFKDRVTIDADFVIDKAAPHPHRVSERASDDGDLHMAGRADEIELPIVAEIQNAKFYEPAIDLVHEVEGTGDSIKMTGAWRIWCEHAADSQQVQGDELSPFDTTNPDHVFEIHPITSLKEISLLSSLRPIVGYRTKDAHEAFMKYENLSCKIVPTATTTTIVTRGAGYNYAEFTLEVLDEEQHVVEDGRMVMCNVHDLDGELLVRRRRMVFVKDSEPDKRVKELEKGSRLHVVGLPRMDLALVDWRVRHAGTRPEVLEWRFPYEMIIIAVYDDEPSEDDDE